MRLDVGDVRCGDVRCGQHGQHGRCMYIHTYTIHTVRTYVLYVPASIRASRAVPKPLNRPLPTATLDTFAVSGHGHGGTTRSSYLMYSTYTTRLPDYQTTRLLLPAMSRGGGRCG